MATYRVAIDLQWGKNESWHLLLPHCRFLDKTFIEMFLEWSSAQNIAFFCCNPHNLIGYHGNQKETFTKKKKLKINSSEAMWGIKLKLCRIVTNISLYETRVWHAKRCLIRYFYISIGSYFITIVYFGICI